jgi:hypothetical protein
LLVFLFIRFRGKNNRRRGVYAPLDEEGKLVFLTILLYIIPLTEALIGNLVCRLFKAT